MGEEIGWGEDQEHEEDGGCQWGVVQETDIVEGKLRYGNLWADVEVGAYIGLSKRAVKIASNWLWNKDPKNK